MVNITNSSLCYNPLMATKTTKKTKKTPKKLSKSVVKELSMPTETSVAKSSFAPDFKLIFKLILVALVGALVFLAVRKYRSFFVAGIVNKRVITRMELNDVLAKRYGQAVLEEMINEEILLQEGKNQGIEVKQEEVDKEFASLKERVGGDEALKTALVQYGLSQDDLIRQIKLRLVQKGLADKLFTIEVTDEEVKEYFTDNAAMYKDKKLDDVKESIKEELKTQKQQQQFTAWFEETKNKAQVQNFLK